MNEQVSFLYTKPNCPACAAAKGLLAVKGELFIEIPADNPATSLGISTLLRRVDGAYIVPLLLRPNRKSFQLAKLTKNGDWEFIKVRTIYG